MEVSLDVSLAQTFALICHHLPAVFPGVFLVFRWERKREHSHPWLRWTELSHHHFPAFRWVFWPAAIIYLLFPSVRWHVSDRILYFGVTDQALTSLYAVSWVKQWLLLRAVSASAVLSYLACDMACKLRTLKTKSRA